MRGHFFVHIFKHFSGAAHVAIGQGAVLLGFFLRSGYIGFQLLLRGVVLGIGPGPQPDQVLFKAVNGVPQGEARRVIGRAVLAGSTTSAGR